MRFRDDIQHQWRYGSPVIKLLLINVGLYLVQALVLLIAYFGGFTGGYLGFIERYFYASTDFSVLARHPWTIFTYMFMHSPYDIFHIISNMLYLYFFGRIFVDFIEPKMATPLYFAGGLVGLALGILVLNFVPAYADMEPSLFLGASASVMAIVLATATLVPDFTVHLILIGPVRLKYIAAFVIIIDLLSIPTEQNLGGHIAHLGGALIGYLYIRGYRSRGNWFSWWIPFTERINRLFEPKRPKVAYVNREKQTSKQNTEAIKQERLNKILDKIRESGYESLSTEEKTFLFKISNEK